MDVGSAGQEHAMEVNSSDGSLDPSGGMTTGSPGAPDRAQVGEPEGHLAPRWLAVGGA
jgi:hypothetical protein